MPNRYFGTDGIRGKYNSSFLNEKFIRYLGYSIAEEFRSANNKNVLIGYDTRQSCKEIVNILSYEFVNFAVHKKVLQYNFSVFYELSSL